MQFPPLRLTNFSIHSLEQRFGGFCFVFFTKWQEDNDWLLLFSQQPAGSAVGRNAIYGMGPR